MLNFSTNTILAMRPSTTRMETAGKSRTELVEGHLYIVASEARRMARRLPGHVRAEDLVGSGSMGLLAAAERFDATRCAEFAPFARMKVRAAMLDELRDLDLLPRRARASLNRIGRARRAFASQHGREPTRQELAASVEMTIEQLDELMTMNDRAHTSEPLEAVETHRVDPSVATDGHEKRETAQRLAQAIASLPQRLQQVLNAYYQGDQTFKEIGARLGVTESRICQLHAEAVRELRKCL